MSAALIACMAIGVLAQASPNFAGKWTREAPAAGAAAPAGGAPGGAPGGGGGRGGGGGGLGMDITITQDATSMTIEYVGGGQAPAPVKLVYKLDGSESKNMMAGRGGAPAEQVAKAMVVGSTIVVTTTTANGDSKRVFSMDGANLKVETTAPGRDGGPGTPMAQIYKKS
ncbi:MAG: hypothetical protein ABI652_03855 [Acidobacteriota bacterium]